MVATSIRADLARLKTKADLVHALGPIIETSPAPFVEKLQLAELRALAEWLGMKKSGRTKDDYCEAILDALEREPAEAREGEAEHPEWLRDRLRRDLEQRWAENPEVAFDVSILPSRPGGLARESIFDFQARLRDPRLRRAFFVSYNANTGLLAQILTVAYDALVEAAVHRARETFVGGPAVVVVLDATHHGLHDNEAGRRLVALAKRLPGIVEVRLGPTHQTMHAKVYAFELADEHLENGMRFEAIVGSSNLSPQGIGGTASANIEANVRIVDGTGFDGLAGTLVRSWLEELLQLTRPLTADDLATVPSDPECEALVDYKRDFDSREELILKALAEQIAARGREAHPLYDPTAIPSFPDHQWVPIVGSTVPDCRGFLLFDEVGLGKTVEAGMILSRELRRWRSREGSSATKGALIIAPSPLHEQWQSELKTKFGIASEIFRPQHRQNMEHRLDLGEGNYWRDTASEVVITSPALARQDTQLIEAAQFDIVLVDECHRAQGEATFNSILDICDGARLALFSSGTPVQNRFSELWYSTRIAIHELVPGEDRADFETAYGRLGEGDIASLHELLELSIARGHRGDLIEAGQMRARQVRDLRYAMEPHEEAAVVALQGLREESRGRRGESAASSLFTLEHVLMSSPHAFLNAATAVLGDLPEGFDPELDDELSSQAGTFEVLRGSTRLCRRLRRVRDDLASALRLATGQSTKEQTLVSLLRDERVMGANVLLFTRFRRTQRRLAVLLTSLSGGERVRTINGGTGPSDRVESLAWFSRPHIASTGPGALLICTDVAAEGLNLQAASSTLVNFDLPWNPQRLEQRIGRLQRWGQRYSVQVFNLWGSISGGRTIDERVLFSVGLRRIHLAAGY
ncbi:MAG: DEAD/DEAH box helicase family protein [Sandaracinaceae bacterium]|nr:DEAD/DEAH box helicase family protein [Sandaracinaceae bacterium]